ncbi:MAG: L,D-transpeptidase family protein [Burkholderiales bacterium]|nr:L,D-transpeptidase family protein [Nitrosomonas sp.]MCP5275857.1 L,D-transpeptidase family protein [Burkholderiales bacterium]
MKLDKFVSQNRVEDGNRNAGLKTLQKFYAAQNFQPVWIPINSQRSKLDTVMSFLATAEDEGLDSHDYQIQRLRQLASDPSNSLYELEFLTTLSLLQFSSDLYRGRFTASIVDPNWHIPQPYFDASSFLSQAIDSGNLPHALETLTPRIPSYKLLKEALAKYRDLAAKQISWPNIPTQHLIRPGDSHSIIPLIRKRIAQAYHTHGKIEYKQALSAENETSHQYDLNLVNAIKAFQLQHGLNADGIIGKNTLNALNKTPLEKVQQLRINMERLRWLPRDLGDRYVLVNIAGFQLAAIENDQYILDMRIIVGRTYRSTPSFQSRITHMITNPFWNVPTSIARKDLLPKQQKDPNYFTNQNIKVYSNYAYNSEPIDPDTIDWQAIDSGFPYTLRQDPGYQNALGTIKFMLPNRFSIYLHDTPSKALFSKDIRTFSSGCIRLEKPLQLAEFALRNSIPAAALNELIATGKTMQTNLPEPLPIYIVYLTVWVDSQHIIHYSPDTYERDKRTLKFTHW